MSDANVKETNATALELVPTEENTKEETANAGFYVHTFKKPFTFMGKEYAKLEFDFESMTGNDMIAVENEMAVLGEYALTPEVSRSYLSKIAAKAAGVGWDMLNAMPLREFNKITAAARNFLMKSGY